MESKRGKRQHESEGDLAQKHCVLVADTGGRVCALYHRDEEAYRANDIFSNANT